MKRLSKIVIILTVSMLAGGFLYFYVKNTGLAGGVFVNPHGNYDRSTTMCGKCHSGHSAFSVEILKLATQRETCYSCHDGTKSNFNVRSRFGETVIGSSVYASYHPVPTGAQLCSNCHDAHLAPGVTPRLLAVGDAAYASGNAVCGGCHGGGSALPGGDMLTSYVYTPHDTAMTPPASGTQIKCSRCHQPHGSPYKPLLQDVVYDQTGILRPVTGNNNTLCYGCHTDGIRNYKGAAVYNPTKHGSTLTSTVALTVYPGTSYAPTLCLNCHEPHGKTGLADYRRGGDNDLCVKCHDAPSVIRPANYSYRSISTYNSIPHSTAAGPTQTGAMYTANSQGFAVWQATGSQAPGSPGASVSDLAPLFGWDTSRLRTGLATVQDVYNTQMYRFKLSEPLASINELRPKWVGYGEPTPNHKTEFSIWNRSFNSGVGGWEKLFSKDQGVEGVFNTVKSNVSNYIDGAGEVFFLAGAAHDGTAPVLSGLADRVLSISSVRITWNTNELARSWVDYGTTPAYGTTVANATYKTPHSFDLTGLTKNVNYYYRVRSEDQLGNQTVSAERTFRLSDPPPAPTTVAQASMIDITVTPVNLNLRWNTVNDPNGDPVQYMLQVAYDAGFTNIVTASPWVDEDAGNPPTQGWNVSLGYGDFHWRVIARDASHPLMQSTSASRSFYISAPKDSCPILYTWDGKKFRFTSEITPGAFIGLELTPGKFQQPIPDEQSVINGDMLAVKDGKYILKIKNDQDEIDFIDNLALQAVDHPVGTQIAQNDFTRSSEPWKTYTFSKNVRPVKKATYYNNPVYSGGKSKPPVDVTALVSKRDKKHAAGSLWDDNQFTFNLGDLSSAKDIKLVVAGWTKFANEGEIKERLRKAKKGIKTAPSLLEIRQPDGTWKSEPIRFMFGSGKTAVLDLSGKFPRGTREFEVRLRGLYRPNLDFVGVDTSAQADIKVTDLPLLDATLGFRGLSKGSQSPEPYFEYYKLAEKSYTHEGRFTKYGNVLPLVKKVDDQLVVMDTGDELTVGFEALPATASGMTRSFVLKPWTYYKVRDKVEPMPYRGMDMSKYPDSLGEYPEELKKYVEEWNTRVHRDGFKENPKPGMLERIKLFLEKIFSRLAEFWRTLFKGVVSDRPKEAAADRAQEAKLAAVDSARPGSIHYSLNTNYIELEVVSTTSAGTPGACINCHAVHGSSGATKQLKGTVTNTCFANGFGCHSDAANSATGAVYRDKFTSTIGYTSRHSVDYGEQSLYGTKVECINCHNPHVNDAVIKTVNPDNRFTAMSQWIDKGVGNYVYSDGTVYVMARARHDGIPPVISGLNHTVNTAAYSVRITWNTDEFASRIVEWGTTTSYVYNTGNPSTYFINSYSIDLTGLQWGIDYHYRVKSTDRIGNVSYSADNVFRLSNPPGTPTNQRYLPDPIPAGNFTETIQLLWDSAIDPDGDAVSYYVEVNDGTNSGWLPVGQTFWNKTVSNNDTVTYSWRVKARDIYGNEGPFTTWASFTHIGPASPPVIESCPILYTWNGEKFLYNTDLAAGGILGLELAPGQFVKPVPNEQTVIPAENLIEQDGRYLIKIKNDQYEIDYIDNMVLQAVDHPAGTRIGLNDLVRRQQPYKVHTYGEHLKPLKKATYVNNPVYSGGRPTTPADITDLISKQDNRHATGKLWDDNQFTFELGDLSKAREIKLVVTGWTEFAGEKVRAERLAKAKKGIKTAATQLEILQPDGTWKSEPIMFMQGYSKTVILDLTGKFPEGTKDYIVRLRGMYRPHIDYVGVDTTHQADMQFSDLSLKEATLDFAGLAEMTKYPAPGFDYDKKRSAKIPRHEGRFTKYGDVLPLINEVDDKLIVMGMGDELTLSFEALPPAAPGMTRSFVLKPWAYFKEQQPYNSGPLPFRDMTRYPYEPAEYPAELKAYDEEWNTREHDPDSGLWANLAGYWMQFVNWLQSLFSDDAGQVEKSADSAGGDDTRVVYGSGMQKASVFPTDKPSAHYSLNTNYLAVGIGISGASKLYLPNSPGSEAWEKDTLPTLDTPGTAADNGQKNRASVMDSSWWITNLVAADGAFNYQLFKFRVDEAKDAINKLSVRWVGYGEPTPGYNTTIHIWNFTTKAWDQLATGVYVNDTAVNFFTNKENSVFCNKCHDNAPPSGVLMGTVPPRNIATSMISDKHGDAVGTNPGLFAPYLAGIGRLACDDCHDPHGNANTYHLRDTVNAKTGLTVTNLNNNTQVTAYCQSCHVGNAENFHSDCLSCHRDPANHVTSTPMTADFGRTCSSCHYHGAVFPAHDACSFHYQPGAYKPF